MKWKNLVSWMKRSDLGRNSRQTNKTMAGEELLENSRQGESWTHWHQRRERPLETLTSDSKSWRLPYEKKTLENLKSWLSQVEMFAARMMLYGWKGFYPISSI